MIFNFHAIPTYLASFILTVALIAPKTAPQSQLPALLLATAKNQIALEAPKAAFLTVDEYARKAASDAGIDPDQFLKLITCESEWKEDAVGDHNRSFGILQFQNATFERFAKKYDMETLNIMNSFDQIDLAVLMFRDGYEEHWFRCSHKVGLL